MRNTSRSERFLTLLRHAEAHKNVSRKHGGPGSALSPKGVEEARRIGQIFAGRKLISPLIKAVRKPQCVETAEILASEGQYEDYQVVDLPTFSLGVVDGLSDENVRQGYGEISLLLEKWRAGEIEAHELRAIPGATDPVSYFSLGQSFLADLSRDLREHDVVLVATRSVLVLIANIVMGRTPEVGGGYREVPWPNASYATFAIGMDGVYKLRTEFTNVAYFT